MKRIFGIMAILLIWAGLANAGVLKVMIPIDEFEQMESRLKALEEENIQMKQGVTTLQKNPSETDKNSEIKKIESQLYALEQENNRLKEEVKTLAAKPSESETANSKEMGARLDSLGRENRQLKQAVASLKETGEILRSDRRTAPQLYFATNKKFASHIFK